MVPKKVTIFYFDIKIKGTVSFSEPWMIIMIKAEKKRDTQLNLKDETHNPVTFLP